MRKVLGKAVFAREGSLVRVECSLPKDVDLLRLSVWVSLEGEEYSPLILVPSSALALTDKPPFFKPVTYRLENIGKREHFRAPETGYYRIEQELDVPDDTLSKSRIYVPSKLRLRAESLWERLFPTNRKVRNNVEQASTSRR